MLIPLFILAEGSNFAGIIFKDLFIGYNKDIFWSDSIKFLIPLSTEHPPALIVYSTPILVTLSIPLSYYLFIKNTKISSYVGMTKDLNKRITLHNSSKGAKYTRGKKWSLAYKKSYNSKSKALKEEYSLKKDKKKREKIKLNFNLKNENFNSFAI